MSYDDDDDRDELLAALSCAQAKIRSLEAQQASRLTHAFESVGKVGKEDLMASGVVVSLQSLDGKSIVSPFMIRDGLTERAIEALRECIAQSFEVATMTNPAMATYVYGSKK